MRVTDQISDENKNQMRNLNVELQVLKILIEERQGLFNEVVKEVLYKLTPNPQFYALKLDKNTGEWELELRPDALAMPGEEPLQMNRAARRQLSRN